MEGGGGKERGGGGDEFKSTRVFFFILTFSLSSHPVSATLFAGGNEEEVCVGGCIIVG